MSEEPSITRMSIENGAMELDIKASQEAMLFWAFNMRNCLVGAENYVQMTVIDKELSCAYILTLQRKEKPTAHELRRRAEAELQSLRARLKDAEGALGFYGDTKTYLAGGTIGPQETWRPAPITSDTGKRAQEYFAKYPSREN